jgi:hypothetical protein
MVDDRRERYPSTAAMLRGAERSWRAAGSATRFQSQWIEAGNARGRIVVTCTAHGSAARAHSR